MRGRPAALAEAQNTPISPSGAFCLNIISLVFISIRREEPMKFSRETCALLKSSHHSLHDSLGGRGSGNTRDVEDL